MPSRSMVCWDRLIHGRDDDVSSMQISLNMEEHVLKFCIFDYKDSAEKAWMRWRRQKKSDGEFYPAKQKRLYEGRGCGTRDFEIVQWHGEGSTKNCYGYVTAISIRDGKIQNMYNVAEFDETIRHRIGYKQSSLPYYHYLGFRGNHLQDAEDEIYDIVVESWSDLKLSVKSDISEFMKDTGRYSRN